MEREGVVEFAVKALIINDGRFLAVHKMGLDSPKYELPGGRLMFGETAEETVVREVLEETGLCVSPVELVDTWNFIKGNRQIAGIIYLCAAEDVENIILSDEHDCYEWLGTDDESLEKMNRLFKPQMKKYFLNE